MFKSVILTVALSFFTLSSVEAVNNGDIFANDDWLDHFKNVFKKPADRKIIKEAIAMDFKDGEKAVYSKDGLRAKSITGDSLLMSPRRVAYKNVLIDRRLPLSQVLESLKRSPSLRKAELRTLSASHTSVYASTRSIVESNNGSSGRAYKFETQNRESKSTFDNEAKKQSVLKRKSQEFEEGLTSFLNTASAKPAQPKAQETKPVVKSKTRSKAPAKATKTPVVTKKVTKQVAPAKKPAAPRAAPSKVKRVASHKKVASPVRKAKLKARKTTKRKMAAKNRNRIRAKRIETKRKILRTKPAVQRKNALVRRNTRAKSKQSSMRRTRT